jgi:hypothetical protein
MHNIQSLDAQYGLEPAWHGLTKVVPHINLKTCWLSQWDIERTPLYTHDETASVMGRRAVSQTPFDMLQCTDNGHLVGRPVGPSYGEITNAQFLDMIDAAISGTAHKIVSCGSLRNRGRVFVTIKLDQDMLTRIGKREFADYLTAGNSHDQSSELFWMNSSICTVCDNTYSANLASVRQAVDLDEQDQLNTRIRHSKHAALRLPDISDVIDKAIGVRAEFYSLLNLFAHRECTPAKAERVFSGFEASKDAKELSTITHRRVNDLVHLFREGRGNSGRTMLDLFQAGTDFYTHSHTGSEAGKQWESSEYGLGSRRKRDLFKLVSDLPTLAACEKRGEELLKAGLSIFD